MIANRKITVLIRFASALIAAAFVALSLIACGDKPAEQTGSDVTSNTEGSSFLPYESTAPDETSGTDKPPVLSVLDYGDYTYRVGLKKELENWNVHNGDTVYTELIAPALVAAVAYGGGGFTWQYDTAESVVDVTPSATAEQRAKWDIAEGETGRVWRITLDPAVAWQDGSGIDASDYLWSMEKLLEPGTEKAAASRYISGDAAIFGARDFHAGIKAGDDIYSPYIVGYTDEGEQIADPASVGKTIYFNSSSKVFFFNDTFDAYYEKYGDRAAFAAMSEYVGKGSAAVDGKLKGLLNSVASEFGESSPDAWKEFCVFVSKTADADVTFTDVGLYAEDDHTLVYVTEESVSEYGLFKVLMHPWLVKKDMYGEDYCTSSGTTASYGPYVMTGGCCFERNESWCGYYDGRHVWQFRPTTVIFEKMFVFDGMEMNWMDFEGREFDFVECSGNYGSKIYAEKPSTERLILVTDRDALKALSTEDANKILLSYKEFRRALSLCIDREDLAEKTKLGSPAYALFGKAFFYDIENDTKSVYRLTDEGIAAISALREGKKSKEIKAEVQKLFSEVYAAALSAGDITENDAFSFTVAVGGDFEGIIPVIESAFNGYIAEATADTPLAGKVSFVLTVRDDRYTAVENGEVEAAIGAWEASFEDVFSAVRLYTDSDYAGQINEICGFDPSLETISVTAEFDGIAETTVEKTYTEWSRAINRGGEYYDAPVKLKLAVLSALESGLIEEARTIPLIFDADIYTIDPMGCNFGYAYYNEISGFGGIRRVGFYYTDKELREMRSGR